jgi:hypothetical protein
MKERSRSAELAPNARLGVLSRDIRVQVLNCSSAGCLLEADASLDVGTVASLRLVVGGQEFSDDVQVVRCRAIAGAGSLHHIGARLLWTCPPGERTLRHALRNLAITIEGGAWQLS